MRKSVRKSSTWFWRSLNSAKITWNSFSHTFSTLSHLFLYSFSNFLIFFLTLSSYFVSTSNFSVLYCLNCFSNVPIFSTCNNNCCCRESLDNLCLLFISSITLIRSGNSAKSRSFVSAVIRFLLSSAKYVAAVRSWSSICFFAMRRVSMVSRVWDCGRSDVFGLTKYLDSYSSCLECCWGSKYWVLILPL